jgi:hypothetical protein
MERAETQEGSVTDARPSGTGHAWARTRRLIGLEADSDDDRHRDQHHKLCTRSRLRRIKRPYTTIVLLIRSTGQGCPVTEIPRSPDNAVGEP